MNLSKMDKKGIMTTFLVVLVTLIIFQVLISPFVTKLQAKMMQPKEA